MTVPCADEESWATDADALVTRSIRERKPELVAVALTKGANPQHYLCRSIHYGRPELLKALIEQGVSIHPNNICLLGDIDITDYLIDSDERERDYAEVLTILLSHGCRADTPARDDRLLIQEFPREEFPLIHEILSKWDSTETSNVPEA